MTRAPVCALLGLAAACGSNDLVLPAEGTPTSVVIVEGNGQSGRVGSVLVHPVVARVTDALDRPLEGISVAFTFDGGPDATVVPDTALTDADGRAVVHLQLGTDVGEGQGVARVVHAEGPVLQAGFSASALPASASEMRAVSGDDQSGVVGSTLQAPLVVEVADAFGNPSEGVTVTWSMTGGGRLSSTTSVTNADGRASVLRTLGSTAGTQTTRASAPGLAGSPVTFTHTAMPAAASRVIVVSGDDQTGPVATRLPQDLVVQVNDANGNPIASATVAWVVTSGGGTVVPATSTTGGNGRTSARWTLGSSPGSNQLEARVVGATAVTFTATATAGASASLAVSTQPSAQASVGGSFEQQPVIQLRDAAGNDVERSGVAVTAAVASGDGSLSGTTTRATDASGRAVFTNLRITGATGPHTLIFAASGHTSVTSSAIDVRKAATITTLTADTPDPSASGQAVIVTFSVTSSGGTPSGVVTVTADGGVESCTASLAVGSCTLVLDGDGSRALTASYGGDALFEGSADTEPHTVVPANGAPSAANDVYTTVEDSNQPLVVPAPGVLANDTDADGDPLRAEGATDPPGGAVTLSQDGSFTYTPASNYWGDDAFTYRASDGGVTSATASVGITVLPVNDAPQFRLVGGEQTVDADTGPQQVPGFAEIVSLGAENEQGQVLQFIAEVASGGAALFAAGPTLSVDGTLTYVPAGAPGTTVVTVRVRDDGGTERGGVDTSPPQTFTITLTGSD